LLFRLDPEQAHELVAGSAEFFRHLPFADAFLKALFTHNSSRLGIDVAGLHFENPLGMAAGFDKTGELYPFLSCMGFGHIECGTFTRQAQEGNPKPRLFRFPGHLALVNRMGFNNPGAEQAAKNFSFQKRGAIRGINLGKSKITDLDLALTDYLFSLRCLLPHAYYIAINVSSPNTPGLRQLQEKTRLTELLRELKKESTVPLFLKIAPDLSDSMLDEILDVALEHSDGLIVCNTTVDKTSVPGAGEIDGGLSGAPLASRSLALLKRCFSIIKRRIPIVSVGGIGSAQSAIERIKAGASLIQIYTGYIYGGPELPAQILRGIDLYCEKEGTTVPALIGASG